MKPSINFNFPDGRKYCYGIEKIDDHLCWVKGKKSKIRYSKNGAPMQDKEKVITRINPIPWLQNKLVWYAEYLCMVLTNTLYKRCQGGGEGIAAFKIRNPNKGQGNEYFNCCRNCVCFYDIRFSRMKITGWKNKKEIAKRM